MKSIDQKIISAGELAPRFSNGTPFMVEGCMILLCTEGRASFSLNFHDYEVGPGDVVFLFNDMVIELGTQSEDFRLKYVTVNSDRSFEIYLSVTSQHFWDKLCLSPVRKFGEIRHGHFSAWIDNCIFVYDSCRRELADRVISGMTVSLFMVMEDIVGQSKDDFVPLYNSGLWKIAGEFFVLLSRHYMSEHKVGFYADALNITPDYLSVVMKECTGTTPKGAIDGKLILAMKALLESTSLSIKNIAERLHYDDTSHLCKVFRRHTGMSPVEYRMKLEK